MFDHVHSADTCGKSDRISPPRRLAQWFFLGRSLCDLCTLCAFVSGSCARRSNKEASAEAKASLFDAPAAISKGYPSEVTLPEWIQNYNP